MPAATFLELMAVDKKVLDGRLRLLGWRRDVPELLHAMDVFLLTSLFEGLPRAVLQAMAAVAGADRLGVMVVDDSMHHGQTESGSLLALGRREGFEQLGNLRPGDTAAVVFDTDLNELVVPGRIDLLPAAPAAASFHGAPTAQGW